MPKVGGKKDIIISDLLYNTTFLEKWLLHAVKMAVQVVSWV